MNAMTMTMTMKQAKDAKPAQRKRKRGVFSIELALTLPVLGIVLLGLFEFSMLFFARGQVVEACRIGARKAALPGVTAEDVEREIREVLDLRLQQGLKVEVHLGRQSGDLVSVALAVPMRSAAPDLLWPVGYSLSNRDLYVETRMIKE